MSPRVRAKRAKGEATSTGETGSAVAGTGFDFDRQMAETGNPGKPALVSSRRHRVIGHNRNNRGAVSGTDLPEMQVGDAVALGFQPFTNCGFDGPVLPHIEENCAGVPNETIGPGPDHQTADDANQRIRPRPLRIHRDNESHDRQHRSCSIGDHVNVGRSQIVVAMMPAIVQVPIVMRVARI